MFKVSLVGFFLIAFHSYAQTLTFQREEIVLSGLLNNLRSAKSDDEKLSMSQTLKDSLLVYLKNETAFVHSFTKLKSLGVVDSPDKSFRIFTWNLELEDLTHKYECVIMRFDERKKLFRIVTLEDNSAFQEDRPAEILKQDQWYGALYYQIIPFEKGNKDLYLVMGWDGFTSMSNRKIIDIMSFNGDQVKFGSPVFRIGDLVQKRVYYEFSESANMSMRWDEQYQRILLDHLSPESSNLKGFYSYYVPDMSYDAFVLEKGKWYLKEDVIAVNSKSNEKFEILVEGKNGEIEKKKIKNTWVNPGVDGDSKNMHVAELPTEETSKTTRKDKKANANSRKEEKKDEKSNIYPLKSEKKRKKR